MNTRIYGWLVGFYPADLRRDFGEEMVLVFAEELRDAGFARAARVWRRALVEFFQLALPGWAAHPALRVPAIMLAFCALSMGIDLLTLCTSGVRARFYFVGMIPTFAMVAIPMAVMWACRGRAVIKLHLDGRGR